MTESKPFCISKWAVLTAWTKVRANKGAAGVDEVSIDDFDKKLKNNLYRIWNHMSEGADQTDPGDNASGADFGSSGGGGGGGERPV